MLVRKYLYIDEDFVNDAFASINGYNYDDKSISNSSSEKYNSNGKTSQESTTSDTTTINANMSIVAKLQNIIEYLEENEGVELIESLSLDEIKKMKREKIFLGLFELRYSKLEEWSNLAESVTKLDEILQTHTFDDRIELEQIQKLAKQDKSKGLPCLLKFVDDNEPRCFSYIDENKLRVNKRQLETDVTILCKVVRVLKDNQSVCLTDITDLMTNKFPDTAQGRKAKVQAIKDGSMSKIKEIEDKITGPALELLPIAIYI